MQVVFQHAFNFTAKKIALACNSCAGWVGRACNLIAVLVVNSLHTKIVLTLASVILLEEHTV